MNIMARRSTTTIVIWRIWASGMRTSCSSSPTPLTLFRGLSLLLCLRFHLISFEIPKRYKGKFKKDEFVMSECVQYTDFAFRRFFETASKMPWFKNTLFVITADHVSLNQRGRIQDDIGYFSVRLFFINREAILLVWIVLQMPNKLISCQRYWITSVTIRTTWHLERFIWS